MGDIESLIVWGNDETVCSADAMIFAKGSFEYIKNDISDIKTRYIKLGFHLCECCTSKYHECFGYTNFYEFVAANFSLDKGAVSRCINVFLEFADVDSHNGRRKMFIADKWKDYSYTQLCEMLPMSKSQREQVKPSMSCSQIREFKKSFKAKPQKQESKEKVVSTQPEKESSDNVTASETVTNYELGYVYTSLRKNVFKERTACNFNLISTGLEEHSLYGRKFLTFAY